MKDQLITLRRGRRRCDIEIAHKASCNRRLTCRILTVSTQLCHRLAQDTVHLIAVGFLAAALGKRLSAIDDRVSVDLLRLIRNECDCRCLTARPRENKGEQRKSRANVGNHPAQTNALTAKCLNGSKCGKEGKGGEQNRRNICDSDQPRENAAAHGDHEDPHRPCDASTAVGQKYAECHEKRQRHRNRQRGTHIVTRIDRRTLSEQPGDERHGHSEEYDSDDEYDEKHPEQN